MRSVFVGLLVVGLTVSCSLLPKPQEKTEAILKAAAGVITEHSVMADGLEAMLKIVKDKNPELTMSVNSNLAEIELSRQKVRSLRFSLESMIKSSAMTEDQKENLIQIFNVFKED